MRFDDSLDTVLAAEMSSAAGIQSAWRQIVDLIGRRRAPPRLGAMARLRAIRDDVPPAVRAASARGLERADPPRELVALFVTDAAQVAAPLARTARLGADEWLELLPAMQPATRGVLRHRRDLDPRVERALAAFGSHDFALPAATASSESELLPIFAPAPAPEPVAPVERADAALPPTSLEPVMAVAASEPVAPPPEFIPPEPLPFVAVADIARDLPLVAEARRLDEASPEDDDFAIAEIVARIEAHQREIETRAPAPIVPPPPADRFRFETDAAGTIRWCEGVARGAVVGLSLTAGRDGGPIAADGVAAGALARRARFTDARLEVAGNSDAAGSWRIAGTPVFDFASGRFTGYRGTARRPRADEQPHLAAHTPATDALRQLVHELRTPANAISGFAEMIEHELLGPVEPLYRDRATAIRNQTRGLLDAIDDLDTAARLESRSLELRPEAVALTPLLTRVLGDLHPLAELRGAQLSLDVEPDTVAAGDARALERLWSRLLTALVAASAPGEVVAGRVGRDGDAVRLTIDRPRAFSPTPDGPLLSADAEVEAAGDGAPLLGAGFAFRLARNLTAELGGSLVIDAETLTLRLPAAVDRAVEQATV
ncbi:MAG: HAMP domain-containing sensor histidine kinase [Pseudomonadota bacterium]